MTQQHPFDSQQEMALSSASSPLSFRPRAVLGGFVTAIPGFPVRSQTSRREGAAQFTPILQEVANQQVQFNNQLAHSIVLFPRTQRVQSNEEGVFIPKSLFGRDAQVRFRQERIGNGGLQVIVYATSPQNGVTLRRRTEIVDCSTELRWLNEHGEAYTGLWVALERDQLLASGPNGREVYEQALAKGATRPFLVQVEPSNELPFGGW